MRMYIRMAMLSGLGVLIVRWKGRESGVRGGEREWRGDRKGRERRARGEEREWRGDRKGRERGAGEERENGRETAHRTQVPRPGAVG